MTKDNVELICNIGELSDLFREKSDVRGFLQRVVKTVSEHMKADVCSIYLYDEYLDRLILEATEGLNQDLIGKLILTPGEGLVGTAMKELRSILEKNGQENPQFKAVPGSGEEPYQAFLAVPILRGLTRIGVLVLQHHQSGYFNKNDMMAFKAIASQLAATLENAKLLMGVTKKPGAPKKEENVSFIRGQAIVGGIGIGNAYVIESGKKDQFYNGLPQSCIDASEEDFANALTQSEEQLQELQAEMEEKLSDVGSLIFSTHLLMLRDSSFVGKMEDDIKAGTQPCDAIVSRVEYFIKIFSESENPRLQEKVQDIRDLGHRLLRNLAGESQDSGDYSGQILIARELLPSELVKITAQHVEGLVLYSQGASAHITILAKSLGVPLVYSDDKRLFSIDSGTSLILDGLEGTLLINPNDDSLKQFRTLKKDYELTEGREDQVKDETYSLDNERIYLRATINLISDIKTAVKMKAEGIGLYRSEFPFLIRNSFPSEEEQYLVYKKIFDGMDHSLITLRALDIGGDKILSYVPDSEEENPFLGLRAIRFLLENKKIFVGQLKAMLRAGQGRKFRIMFPLISSLDDFRQARRMVEKSIEFLKRDGFECDTIPELGVMIELPSAVIMAEDLAREADFISVGSNDLVQYLLGVDRTNEKVSGLYDARHPAVLRTIALIAEAAEKENCSLSICGNMAFNKEMVYFLVGAGIRNLSMPPVQIPGIQKFLNAVDIKKAEQDFRILLSMNSLEDIHTHLESAVSEMIL
ncbi:MULTISPECIES: phosphoenolpyruvate--protein phosphotransferase [unclassified Oceanispirochaeta]|uniref:phosphoenolpyruvate--protein phosphotransferase n=1 Tax=unclassified Oceanispirochaeta TaxID=2635722 RepID=UPI000E099D9D|nr:MULTISPECIES: phosphoenolpyruvate--protein phosphotransferase [unclassified Oceanispirochaeta]MBF9017386.1 phosphoenolpyruvate--protein phosphotransferase [Oceanispirochaeta sp. M2]NPD73760.1 phosphoenolpyruvate--protein phosphotransferase [Oceanispirochaeta sp. M1]RDG30512.1 phosphoenolpyruvate--protein phosphotransferase [Oceanispirochaeta sp. M1]